MASQPESRLQKKIQKHLKKVFPGIYLFKMWGGPFTPAGVPDLLCCYRGRFIALEVKLPKKSSKPSEIQLKTIEIIKAAGGIAAVVRSVEEACWYVEASTKLKDLRVDPATDCWETNVYRKVAIIQGKRYRLYQLYYLLFVGAIAEGMHICHKCDNPFCVNPSHLWQGTHLQNHQDKMTKGRHNYKAHPGEANGSAKLTLTQVKEIRSKYVPRVVTMDSLAREYGVAKSQISFIIKGKAWK
jgi:hypothetical protein